MTTHRYWTTRFLSSMSEPQVVSFCGPHRVFKPGTNLGTLPTGHGHPCLCLDQRLRHNYLNIVTIPSPGQMQHVDAAGWMVLSTSTMFKPAFRTMAAEPAYLNRARSLLRCCELSVRREEGIFVRARSQGQKQRQEMGVRRGILTE